jgi:hypothetical protein
MWSGDPLPLEPGFDEIEKELQIPDLTRFPVANRSPLRLKTLHPQF